jgi:quinoprotein glucose dehydrogenase
MKMSPPFPLPIQARFRGTFLHCILLLTCGCFVPNGEAVSVDQNDIQQTSNLGGQTFLKTLNITSGWEGAILAEDPDIMDPTSLAIDEKGRVFVAETPRFRHGVEDNRNHRYWAREDMAVQTLEDRLRIYQKYAAQHEGGMSYFSQFGERVRVLEQKNGKWTSKVFADGFNDPLDGTAGGLFAFKGDVWFSSIPSVWRLREVSGAGSSTEIKAIHRGFGIGTSISGHDLNGFAMGLDGRLYFSVGDRGYNLTTTEGHHLYAPTSGAVFRMEMDGSRLEVIHRGLRNPKEVAFDQWGNLFSVDNNADIGDKARIVQVVEGGDSGWDRGHQNLSTFRDEWDHPKPNANLWIAESWWNTTGTDRPDAVLPPADLFGTGPSGLAYFPGTGFAQKWNNTFLLADYTGRGDVNAFRMKASGAGFVMESNENVLRGMDTPDIEFGYDGRLYVVDMKNGFMTKNDGRLLAFWDTEENPKPVVSEVADLFRNGIENLSSPRLAELLAHADMRVRLRAEWELTSRPDGFTYFRAACASGEAPLKRLHATYGLGILARKNRDSKAMAQLLKLAMDEDPVIRARAAEAIGENALLAGKPQAFQTLLPLLMDENAQVQMLAAIAIGKTAEEKACEPLFELLKKNADADAYLRHGAVVGLAELGVSKKLVAQITNPDLAIRRGVLLALRRLHSKEVTRFLEDVEPSLVREAIQAIHDGRIVEGYAALGQRSDLLGKYGAPVTNRILCARILCGQPHDLLALLDVASDVQQSAAVRLEALWYVRHWEKSLGINPVTGAFDPAFQASKRQVDEKSRSILAERLQALADENNPALLSDVLLTLEEFNLELPQATQRSIFLNLKSPVSARIQTLEKLGPIPELLRAALEDPILEIRMRGLEWLAASDEAAALERLERGIRTASIREKQLLVALLGRLQSVASAQKLNAYLANLRQLPSEIQADFLASASLRKDCEASLMAAQSALKSDSDLLAEYRAALSGGNPETGRNLFYNSPIAMCSRCHSAEPRVAGGVAGPNLGGVQTKGDEYLLRAMIDPSADFAPGYAPIAVTLKTGDIVAGVLMERDAKATKVKVADGQVRTLKFENIASTTNPVSPMPPMGKLLSLMELRDIVAFLKTLTPENQAALETRKKRPEVVVKEASRYLDVIGAK